MRRRSRAGDKEEISEMGWYKRGRVRSTGPAEFQVHTSQLLCDLSIPTMNSYRLDPREENQFRATCRAVAR